MLALTVPSDAQFWGGGWGGWERRPPRAIPQQQQPSNPFGGWWGNNPYEQRREPQREQREAPADFSRAPAPQRKAADAATTPVLVLGDGMADWLAYGLEDAFAENPDISIVRKNRAASGLIRYDTRRDRDIEWPQVVREAIAADKPKFILMMIGVNDRQSIRERAPAAAPGPRRPGSVRTAPPPAPPPPAAAPDPELQAQQSADQQNAEMQGNPEPPPASEPEPGRAASAGSATYEFHTEKWEAAYIKRIDATIAAMKSAGVPVFWVGLPAQRGNRATSDSAYLNELYRGRAEKAGLGYVDVWDGFVDDQGRFVVQGPDFEGQTRRLRASDGVYFTKAGARKLAHYVEREIQRSMSNRAVPVVLPAPEPAPTAPNARTPGGASTQQRPLAGPVVPLTVSTGGGDELLGGGTGRGAPARPVAVDPTATRVLTKGEPIAAPGGRADDFSWPRGSAAAAAPASPPASTAATASAPAAMPPATAGQRPNANANAEVPAEPAKPPVRRRPPPARTENNPPRPPQSIVPSAQGWWR
jgi:uncharacterized protein